MKLCKQCKKCGECKKPYSELSNYAERCKEFEELKQTNYERIRNMSVEEMAKFLIMVGRLYGGKTPTNVKQWLEQEVSE